jgi:hypothetical protein
MSATHKSNMIKFWTRICNTYPAIKSADNVMFELCNEPVNIESTLGNGDWGSSQDKYDKAYQTYMNDIVSAIRNTGADNVIWVPGMVWQARLSMFANYPISGSNIGYSGHKYPNGHDDCNDADWSDWNTCANKYPIIITEGSWNNMNSDQGLRRGTTAGFGNALKSHCDAAGNVSMYCGMVGEVIGNIGGGPNNWNLTGAIGGAQAAFEWWTTYTSCAPTGSAQYGGGGGGSSTVGNGTYKIVARHSGKALDAYGNQTANGTQIIQWTYGGGSNQKWTLTDTGSGNYKIIGVQSGRAVDVSNGGTANGTKVQLWDYVANSAQLYKFTATSGGYYRITPNCATGSCLDVSGVSTADGANVQLWQWLSGNNQQWALQSP